MSLLIDAASASDAQEEISFLDCACIDGVWPMLWDGDEADGESIPGSRVGREMGIGRLGEGETSFNADLELVSCRNWCWGRLPMPIDKGLGESATGGCASGLIGDRSADCLKFRWPGRDSGGSRMDASLLLLGPEGEDNKFEEEGIEVEKERFTSLDGISAPPLQKYKKIRISKSVS